jgi:hypothetical protein
MAKRSAEDRLAEEWERRLAADAKERQAADDTARLSQRTEPPYVEKTMTVDGREVKVHEVDPAWLARRKQDQELIEQWKAEYFPGKVWQRFEALVEPLSQEGRRLLALDLKFPEGWLESSNESLLDALYYEGIPFAKPDLDTFRKMRQRLREKFKPVLPRPYADLRIRAHFGREVITQPFENVEGVEDLLLRHRKRGDRTARRALGEITGEYARRDTETQTRRGDLGTPPDPE